ncbi:MAG: hypothetical protein IKQ10_04990 [Oscillospiraceae bacterium]|nr:hypothetical protein [Oscillospiraceae bacterium]
MSKRKISLILALILLVSILPTRAAAILREEAPPAADEAAGASAQEAPEEEGKEDDTAAGNLLAGKTVSILGDSISTFKNYSNWRASRYTNYNISRGKSYYYNGRYGMHVEDTWWYQLIEDLGLRLLVNNSWSGSTFYGTRAKTTGAFDRRCLDLHDNTGSNAGEEPDIIIVYLGTNDFTHFREDLGTAEIDYDALFPVDDEGTVTYARPTTALEAAAVCLHKISDRYPNAELYMIELPQRGDADEAMLSALKEFDSGLAAVAEHFDTVFIPLYDSVITVETAAKYYADKRIHPNRLGMDVITEAVKNAILTHTAWETDPYQTVALDLMAVEADYGANRLVRRGDPFSCTLKAAAEGDVLAAVTMDGEDITDEVWADGKITIPAVTGDVTIMAWVNLPEETDK